MDQEAGEEDDEGVVDKDQLVGLEAKVSKQWEKTGDTFAGPVNFDLSDNSETEGEENDFYIDDSEPADLKGLMVVYDEETLFQYKHKDNELLEFEPNNNNDEFGFKFEEEEDELEFNYEPGISLASLATCACPCLRHHETGHCQQLYVLLARQNMLSESLCHWLSHLTIFSFTAFIYQYTSENSPRHLRLSPEYT